MKRILPLHTLAFFGMLSTSASAEPACRRADPLVRQVVKDNTAFAIDLYAQVRRKPGNLFFSPVSVSTALAMTLAGARGETADEMKRTLHFTLDPPKLDQAFGRLLSRWRAQSRAEPSGDSSEADPPSPELFLANRVWVQAGVPLRPAFVTVTKNKYGAPVAQLDFARSPEPAREEINRWVEQQTRNKISKLLQPGTIDSDTAVVLTNAIYFKGAWASPFDESYTSKQPFFTEASRSHPVQMMHQVEEMAYAKVDGAQVLEMDYAHRGSQRAFSLMIILPTDRDGLASLESGLSADRLSSWIGSLKNNEVDVYLPKFTFTSDFQLNDTLEQMGMRHAFTPEADFSGITAGSGIYISHVVHKAFVGVDEKGTEAAAATAVVATRSTGGPGVEFRADHPFLMVLRDKITGSILFMGRVVDPSAS